jgi:hypothetical protein
MGNLNPVNAGKPWTKSDIFLVGSYVPTYNNAVLLASHLGRTVHAIQYMWCKLYTNTTQLKEWAKPENDTKTGQYKLILEVRKELDLMIGR